MKVLLVNGSPHKNGSTDRALQEVAKTLEAGGVETEIFWIGTAPIGGCIGCGGCGKKGECVFGGPVVEFVRKAKTADGFAIHAEKSVTIVNEHTGGKATCKDKAVCEICGEEYGTLDPANHSDLKYFPAKAATKNAEGNIEYWYCSGCGKYFGDKDAAKEIKKADTITEKLKDDPKSPQTGDTSHVALWLSLLLVSGGAIIGTAVVSKKKKG